MAPDLSGILIIVGNYGSGKTEVAVNLAMRGRLAGKQVRIADLDLVNPYFRTREALQPLTDLGVDVVTPDRRYLNADLPILPPQVSGMIRQPSELTILDVGGDPVGATVLAALADALRAVPEDRPARMIQVVNPHRPHTDTIEGARAIGRAIENTSRLTITGVIGNANLIDDTTIDTIHDGHDFCARLAGETGVPLLCVTAPVHLLPDLDMGRITCPVLPIARQMTPPWKRRIPVGP